MHGWGLSRGNIQSLLAETRVTLIIQHMCPLLSEKNCTDYAEEERMCFNLASLSLHYPLCAGLVFQRRRREAEEGTEVKVLLTCGKQIQFFGFGLSRHPR